MKSSLLLEITGKNRQLKPSYLFGTIHLYDPAIFRIPERVNEAIAGCDLFAIEMDSQGISYTDMISRITFVDPDLSLKQLLKADVYARIMGLKSVQGIEFLVDRYKPFFVTSLFMSDYSDEQNNSVDIELLSYAQTLGKIIVGLETFDSQVEVIDQIPLREQAQMLEASLEQEIDFKESFKKIMYLYRDQDFDGMIANLALMSPSAQFVEQVQKLRNIGMSKKIDELINTENTLFASMGALHLVDTGDIKGIVSLLSEKGYQVKPIPIDLTI